MRTLVLILVIALLPVRMWAADGMALRMAQQAPSSATASTMDAMPADCPMLSKAEAASGSAEASSAGGGAHCMTCHLCAAAACLQMAAFDPHGGVPAQAPEAWPSRFLSADLAPDLRPPIS